MKRFGIAILMALVALSAAGTALAQATPVPAAPWITLGNAEFYNTTFRALVILFVSAILVESALSVIFNWRLFMVLFYGRGMRTLVMIAVSAMMVWTFRIDVVHTMLASYGLAEPATGGDVLSRSLTALILSGGSSGVYRLLVALGYRAARPVEEVHPKPKPDKAWISVRVVRAKAVGPVLVRLAEVDPVGPDTPPHLAGVIAQVGFWRRVRGVFLLDETRFPEAGGYEVDVDKQYRLEVSGRDATGASLASDIDGSYSFAPGALIDLVARL